ncbi:putative transporter C38C10.2 [Papilio machaon]|uniref:Putative transporter C38C10.2 n=1 Tax=Papilio machaon TaxID=76193 RepID=A0A194RD70_PAPMA|nr:putative transporter C38C10.2 [Papilio machaon]
MIFTSCWVVYMLRVNMSLNLIAMVPPTPRNVSVQSQCGSNDDVMVNKTIHNEDIAEIREAPRQDNGRAQFNWSTDQQAMILGAYFWCYPITSLVGGMAAERWGPRYVVLISSLASAILTALGPVAARYDYIALIVTRFFLGFAGWASAFYVPAALTIVWCAFWWYLVADTPNEHPRISDQERKYILDALGDRVTNAKGLPPFKSIVTSFPFLAMTVLHYGNLWGLYFIMTVGPKFVSSVLGFELSAAGIISALPYLARLFSATIFGAVGDCILSKQLMTTTAIRKFFCLFSHILPGVLLILLVYTGCSTALSVTMITMSMGFNGAATLTNLQNHQDLAPNFAGTLYGIANFVGSTAGFFTPMITAYFTRSGNSFDQWRPVFFVGASVYIISAVFFIAFGTGNIQPWNFIDDDKEKNKAKPNETKEMNEMTIKNENYRERKETSLSVVT